MGSVKNIDPKFGAGKYKASIDELAIKKLLAGHKNKILQPYNNFTSANEYQHLVMLFSFCMGRYFY